MCPYTCVSDRCLRDEKGGRGPVDSDPVGERSRWGGDQRPPLTHEDSVEDIVTFVCTK